MSDLNSLTDLCREIAHCTVCAEHLPLGPRPVVRAAPTARLLVIGQAPGRLVHASGVPWDDPSGKRLRQWMGVDADIFYDSAQVGIVPMGFCFPGTGKSGDLPPRPECAPLWHEPLLAAMPAIDLTLLIGQYAQNYYLQDRHKKNLTETVPPGASSRRSICPYHTRARATIYGSSAIRGSSTRSCRTCRIGSMPAWPKKLSQKNPSPCTPPSRHSPKVEGVAAPGIFKGQCGAKGPGRAGPREWP